jgi:ketosteroid isomerase-like protein
VATSSNTETVAGVYEAFARGDVEAVMAAMDPEVAWVTPPTLPWSRGRYHGRDGLAEYFDGFLTALADARVEPEEFLDAGERIVVLGHERARGAESGRRFAARFAHVWTVIDGRVARMEGVVDTATIRQAIDARS